MFSLMACHLGEVQNGRAPRRYGNCSSFKLVLGRTRVMACKPTYTANGKYVILAVVVGRHL
jgi:hypothetical protein